MHLVQKKYPNWAQDKAHEEKDMDFVPSYAPLVRHAHDYCNPAPFNQLKQNHTNRRSKIVMIYFSRFLAIRYD